MTKIPPVSLVNSQIVPYSCEFIDGSLESCLLKPVNFVTEVLPKIDLVYDFYLHFATDLCIGVRITDGLFYRGERPGDPHGWFQPPSGAGTSPRKLKYARNMQGTLGNGKLNSSVVGYTLGYTSLCEGKIKECTLRCTPSGDIKEWLIK